MTRPNRRRRSDSNPPKGGSVRRRDAEAPKRIPFLGVGELGDGEYELLPPRCAVNRALDMEEVHEMIAADEPEVARDELLYLVEDCRGFLEAYNLLGELALAEGDFPLARGYYGFAYETTLEALPKGFTGTLPHDFAYNVHFFDAGQGVARCLVSLGDRPQAREVLKKLLQLDPTAPDPAALLAELDAPPPFPSQLPILPS